MHDVIKRILESSDRVKDGRVPYYVLSKCMEELGELSTEVTVTQGHGYKPEGKDGVIGEIVDTMACLVDLAYLYERESNPEITLDEINKLLYTRLVPKLDKWESKVKTKNRGLQCLEQ